MTNQIELLCLVKCLECDAKAQTTVPVRHGKLDDSSTKCPEGWEKDPYWGDLLCPVCIPLKEERAMERRRARSERFAATLSPETVEAFRSRNNRFAYEMLASRKEKGS